jgi:hypothetical protein
LVQETKTNDLNNKEQKIERLCPNAELRNGGTVGMMGYSIGRQLDRGSFVEAVFSNLLWY